MVKEEGNDEDYWIETKPKRMWVSEQSAEINKREEDVDGKERRVGLLSVG